MTKTHLGTRLAALLLLSMPPFGVGCDDDEIVGGDVTLVTVQGIVVNVDDATIAQGVLVSLLDTEYTDAVMTGTDGAFSIDVPEGSELLLFTDDPPTAKADNWFPLINVEMPLVVANEDIEGLIIHACPATSGTAGGSVAIWDDYLANQDDQTNGDAFAATSSAASAGIVTALFWECDAIAGASPDERFLEGIQVTASSTDFPMCYPLNSRTFGVDLAVQSESICESADSETDVNGWALSFGDPASTDDSIEITIVDTNVGRALSFESPATIPVRPGTISLVWGIVVDGVLNVSVNDLIDCLNSGPAP